MDRLELVKRNIEEIVTEEELQELLKKKEDPRAYVGYEPSGKIHMGHVLTVNKLIDLQKAGFKITVLLADMHAYLNKKGTLEEVRKIADYNRRCFIALGLDEESARCTVRVGLGRFTSPDEVEFAGKKIVEAARKLRMNSPQYQMEKLSEHQSVLL